MYNQKQVAEMLGVPARTIRRYSSEFASHLSKKANIKGKHRRYSEKDLVALQRIRLLKGQRLGVEEIDKRLKVTSADPPEGFSLAMIPAFQEKLSSIDTVQRDHDQRLDRIESRLESDWRQFQQLPRFVRWLRSLLGLAPPNPFDF